MFQALSGQGSGSQAVRQALLAAYRARVRIALEVASGEQTSVMSSTIEQLRDEDLVVSQPSIGGLTHPLAFGEHVRISFVHQSMYHSGQSRCLGRVKIPAGSGSPKSDGAMLFAYRLAIPETMKIENRRSQQRVQVNSEFAPEAQLYASATGAAPVTGIIEDISMLGAKFVTSMSIDGIEPHQPMFLKSVLPDPVGLVDEMIDIARIDRDPRGVRHSIGLQFQKRIEGLDVVIRNLQYAEIGRMRRTA